MTFRTILLFPPQRYFLVVTYFSYIYIILRCFFYFNILVFDKVTALYCTYDMCSEVIFFKSKKIMNGWGVVGGVESLVHKHLWRRAPSRLHVLLFPAMH